MQLERIWLGRWLVLIVLVISHVIVVLQSSGDASEVAGMITEIDVRSGNAAVRRVDVADWRPASPLLALDVGDVVRVNGDGYVVVLLAGGRGSLRIDATNSPVVIQGPRPTQDEPRLRRAWVLLEEGFWGLFGLSRDLPQQKPLGSRGPTEGVVLLTPRNGPVLPEGLAFEWEGNPAARYTLRLVGPAGLVFARPDVTEASFSYPIQAPPLVSGVRYEVEVVDELQRSDKAWFEVADRARAETMRKNLRDLETDGASLSAETLAMVKVGYLVSEGFLADARSMLIAATARNQRNPALLYVLGKVYERLGLYSKAAESFSRARDVESEFGQPGDGR